MPPTETFAASPENGIVAGATESYLLVFLLSFFCETCTSGVAESPERDQRREEEEQERRRPLVLTFHRWISPLRASSSYANLFLRLAPPRLTSRKQANNCLPPPSAARGDVRNLLTPRQEPFKSLRCLFHVSVFGFGVMRPSFEGTQQARLLTILFPRLAAP